MPGVLQMAFWQTFDKLMPRYCCKNTLAHMGALPASGTLRAAWETPAICWPRTADCIHVPCALASCPSPRRFNSAWVLPLRLLQVGKNINTRKHSEHMWLGLTWPCCLHVWVSRFNFRLLYKRLFTLQSEHSRLPQFAPSTPRSDRHRVFSPRSYTLPSIILFVWNVILKTYKKTTENRCSPGSLAKGWAGLPSWPCGAKYAHKKKVKQKGAILLRPTHTETKQKPTKNKEKSSKKIMNFLCRRVKNAKTKMELE